MTKPLWLLEEGECVVVHKATFRYERLRGLRREMERDAYNVDLSVLPGWFPLTFRLVARGRG